MPNLSNTDMMALEAAAFRRLVAHFRTRQDLQNVDLMGYAGFCRNCLADWLVEESAQRGAPLTVEEARHYVYGEPYAAFKARQPPASAAQLQRMQQSMERNSFAAESELSAELDDELDDGFPASDPPTMTHPR